MYLICYIQLTRYGGHKLFTGKVLDRVCVLLRQHFPILFVWQTVTSQLGTAQIVVINVYIQMDGCFGDIMWDDDDATLLF